MKRLIISTLCTLILSTAVRAQSSDYISTIYLRYLGQLPNPRMHANWTLKLQFVPPIEFEARVLGGDAYFQRVGQTNVGFIYGLFRDILNERHPHPAEVQRWMGHLRDTQWRELVAQMFLAEYHPAYAQRQSSNTELSPPPVSRPSSDSEFAPPPPTQPLRYYEEGVPSRPFMPRDR